MVKIKKVTVKVVVFQDVEDVPNVKGKLDITTYRRGFRIPVSPVLIYVFDCPSPQTHFRLKYLPVK